MQFVRINRKPNDRRSIRNSWNSWCYFGVTGLGRCFVLIPWQIRVFVLRVKWYRNTAIPSTTENQSSIHLRCLSPVFKRPQATFYYVQLYQRDLHCRILNTHFCQNSGNLIFSHFNKYKLFSYEFLFFVKKLKRKTTFWCFVYTMFFVNKVLNVIFYFTVNFIFNL